MAVSVSRKELTRVVVAVDPAVTSGEDSDETGIVVVGRGPHQDQTCKLTEQCRGHGYVLDDLTCRDVPSGWARRAVGALDKWQANQLVAEVNNGGDMVGETVRAVRLGVPYEAVRATKGKLTRAEPASALYEQGRVHHLGSFPELEDQLTTWTPDSGESPDRLDALVWGLTALRLIGGGLGPLIHSDEEWAAIQIAERRSMGEPIPEPAPLNAWYSGDASMSAALDLDPGDEDPGEKPNGKTARSPYA